MHRYQIERFTPVTGEWTSPNIPPEFTTSDGAIWDWDPPENQIKSRTNPAFVAGYRERNCAQGRSRHLYVLQDEFGRLTYRIDHRETNPNCSPEHAKQHGWEVVNDFAERHPVAAVAVGAAALGLTALAARAIFKSLS